MDLIKELKRRISQYEIEVETVSDTIEKHGIDNHLEGMLSYYKTKVNDLKKKLLELSK